MMSRASVLLLPGWTGAGPEHWQSHWARAHPEYRLVEQANWDTPTPEDWLPTIGRAVEEAAPPVVLVAQSLGCIAAVRWASQADSATLARVAGAFLVAPADIERKDSGRIVQNLFRELTSRTAEVAVAKGKVSFRKTEVAVREGAVAVRKRGAAVREGKVAVTKGAAAVRRGAAAVAKGAATVTKAEVAVTLAAVPTRTSAAATAEAVVQVVKTNLQTASAEFLTERAATQVGTFGVRTATAPPPTSLSPGQTVTATTHTAVLPPLYNKS